MWNNFDLRSYSNTHLTYPRGFSSCRTSTACTQCTVCVLHTVDSQLVKSDIKQWGLMFVCYICLSAAHCLLFHLYFIYCWRNYFHVWFFRGMSGAAIFLMYPHSHTHQTPHTQGSSINLQYRWRRPQSQDGWVSDCDILNLLPLSGCLFEFSSPLYHIQGGILLNCSNRSVNIMGKATETWNVALITTLIYRGQSLSACGGNLTLPFSAHDFLFDLVYTLIKQMYILYYIWYNMFV